MADQQEPAVAPPTDDEPIPFMQRVLDNPFLLLFLGVAVPAVFYIIWGIVEITQIPSSTTVRRVRHHGAITHSPVNGSGGKNRSREIELIWILIAFVWGLIMFFMMIYWHGAGEQNLSNEAYKITPAQFSAKRERSS